MAWSQLELCGVGRLSWRASQLRTHVSARIWPRQNKSRERALDDVLSAPGRDHLRAGDGGVGLLPRGQLPRQLIRPAPDVLRAARGATDTALGTMAGAVYVGAGAAGGEERMVRGDLAGARLGLRSGVRAVAAVGGADRIHPGRGAVRVLSVLNCKAAMKYHFIGISQGSSSVTD